MEYQIGYVSSKYIAPEMHLFKPEEKEPPKNKLILCLSKYGVLRIGTWNPSYDRQWSPLPRVSK